MSRITKALARVKIGGGVGDVNQARKQMTRRRLNVASNDAEGQGFRLADICKKSVQAPEEVLHANRILTTSTGQKGNAIDDYKMLRTKVLRRLASNRWRSIAITSTRQAEGKTLTALNLGISISRDRNYDVILVDADLRSPSIHHCLGIQPECGLTDYIEGNATLEDMLISPGIEGFAVIPNCEATDYSSEALMSPQMGKLVDDLHNLSRSVIIIYDLPPLVVDDAIAFAPMVDSMMLVYRAGVTSRDDAAASKELTADLPLLGCVINGDSSAGGVTYY